VAGYFKATDQYAERSLTILTTMLKQDDINLKRRKKSAEHVLFDQSGPSTSSAIWGLVNSNNDKLKPSIDLDITFTREFHRISTHGQIEERSDIIFEMWNRPSTGKLPATGRAEQALAHLLHYAKTHPDYQETQHYFEYDLAPESSG
jgi:hypothetical protein